MNLETLHVIAVVSNPHRYQSRYNLFEAFKKQCQDSPNVELHVVEMAFGERPYQITTGAPGELQLRSINELWHKENMINLGFARLPQDWKYAAWIDADVQFARPDWAVETLQQLQHYQIVQMFSHAQDLTPSFAPSKLWTGFVKNWQDNGFKYKMGKPGYYGFGHPGYAWAINRATYDAIGGLIDFAPLGAGDHHMAMAWIHDVDESIPNGVSPGYRKALTDWAARADRAVNGDLGFVPGVIQHYWHGKKADRRYTDRWKIIVENQFDPATDIYRDSQGLWQLTEDKPRLRNQIRLYFQARNEDSIDE